MVTGNITDLKNFSIYYLNLFKEKKVEEIYGHFSETAKVNTNHLNLEKLVSEVSQNIGNTKSINSIKVAKLRYEGQCFYRIISDVDTEKHRVIYTVILDRRRDNNIVVIDFSFWLVPRKPIFLFSFKYASLGHYLVFVLFVLIVAAQLMCIILYLKLRPKRKWLYIIGSLMGAPFGVRINWTTLAITYSFGFNIPAVAISYPPFGDRIYTVALFFPLGLIFLFDILRKKKSKAQTGSTCRNGYSVGRE